MLLPTTTHIPLLQDFGVRHGNIPFPLWYRTILDKGFSLSLSLRLGAHWQLWLLNYLVVWLEKTALSYMRARALATLVAQIFSCLAGEHCFKLYESARTGNYVCSNIQLPGWRTLL
jgi:hypothetical protein